MAPATVPVTDDQLLEVYLSGGASRLASVLGRSLPAHVAVQAPHPNDRNQMSGFWGRNLSSQMNNKDHTAAVGHA